MKILIVVHYFQPHIGGMEEVAKKQAESLVGMGHDVTLLTCRPTKEAPLTEKLDGYTIKRLRSLNFIENKFGVTFPLISPLYFFKLLHELSRYDTVHIHDVFYMSSHIAAFAAMLRKKTFFLTQHVAMVDHPSKLVMLVQTIVYGIFGRLLFAKARRIVCYNTNVRDFLLRFKVPKNKILLNYNGIDIDYFSPVTEDDKQKLRNLYDLPSDKPIVLFVGRLVPKKGYGLVYETNDTDHFTLIVGTGDIPPHMEQSPYVRFFGSATPAELRDLYRASDVFVFPAIGEIFTLVIQEAMASGLPVITTDDPAYKTAEVSDSLIRFSRRNGESLKEHVTTLLKDPLLLKKMSLYSRQLAIERFSWQTNYEKEVAIYAELGNNK